jgi:hypothetical protein
MGAAKRAPKKVPADRIETIRESSEAESLGFPVASTPVAKPWSQYGIAKIPEIVPVSYLRDVRSCSNLHWDDIYPKRTPPKATNRPMAIAGL